jgi:acyl-CoA hydrolase
MEGQPVAASEVTFARTMTQADANLVGNVHGGVIMKEVDNAAGTAAARHVGRVCVTAAIDELSFLQPVHIGDVLIVSARVNDVGRTSLEVALDEEGRTVEVPPLLVETEDERRRQAQARIRREIRKERTGRVGYRD